MIYALLSDIHSNSEALTACLRHAEDSGAERYAFLGDLVGYGADAQAVVDCVADYASRGAIVVKGNHDEAVAADPGDMNDVAMQAIRWTREHIDDKAKSFLAGLPLIVREEAICFVHSSAANPERWDYVDGPNAARESIASAARPYTFSGHVHDQILYFQTGVGKIATFRPDGASAIPVKRHHRWLALAGSVGQPRDGNPAAAYALFDDAREELVFHRVPYDNLGAASKIRAAGLAEELAYRIENGI